ncbi:chemotaxis protein CheW [Shewanella zhangzhouensis]|uniref:chemotaxis protein CheW n=1 Tax=Shewanella zhangzhouensis TaxID=2864213 RepID=UPI001C6553F9|nr:chemotaxis protein CheW [Shewanella zhangzhouensis]QYK03936.1 chemotaxis protein CheW [Shewanella zhangzhouensis]
MSKSVDETVVDFFRLLLSEDAQAGDKSYVVPNVAGNAFTDAGAPGREALPGSAYGELASAPSIPQPVKTEPQIAKSESAQSPRLAPSRDPLDKASLEKLLAPVFDVKPVEQPAVAQPAIEQKSALVESTPVVAETVAKPKIAVKPQVQEKVKAQVTLEAEQQAIPAAHVQTAPQTQTGATPPSITKDLREELDDEFQVLFFKVAGLTLAVPLVSLGGIVKVERINHIFGRPDWFLGVQTHRESQLNLVDTCAWVMPEKYNEELAQNVNYQYLVLLEDSNWGLACESLVNSVRIKQSQVNWRTTAGKRPWLAGVVKEQMCGILNVRALIQMLNAGLGCQDPIS